MNLTIGKTGVTTKNADGNTVLEIAHGLGVRPDYVLITFDDQTAAAQRNYSWAITETYLTITWVSAPVTPFNVHWEVKVNQEIYS